MPVAIPQFWKLLGDSGLYDAATLAQFQRSYASLKGAPTSGSAQILAEYLVSEGALTRYQARIVLAGRAGPFRYGQYCIADRVESGRLAGSFFAQHAPTGHPVLLTFLSGAVTEDARLWQGAVQQLEAARGIVHPNVARAYELVDLTRFKFAVSEQLYGATLADRLAGGSRLPVAEACGIAQQLAIGLERVHAAGQAHGELRPENVWLQGDGLVKLLHVPLSRNLARPAGSLDIGSPDPDGGTARRADYSAPEMARRSAQATPGSDIYSLGCLTFEMLTGQPPFAGGTAAEKMQRHASQPIASLTEMGMPAAVQEVVTYMMAKNPSVRFQHAAQVVERFESLAKTQAPSPQPLPSTAAYESYLQSQSGRSPAAAPAAAAPAFDSDFAFAAPRAASPFQAPESKSTPARPASSGSGTSARKSRRRKRDVTNLAIGWGTAAVAVVVIAAVIANQPPGPGYAKSESKDRTPTEENETTESSPAVEGPAAEPAANENPDPPVDLPPKQDPQPQRPPVQLIRDNGRALWVSPTQGQPLKLRYLPPGVQVFMTIRPAELFISEEGERLRAALGPTGQAYLELLEQTTRFDVGDLEQVVIGLQAERGGAMQASLVVHLREPIEEAALVTLLGRPQSQKYRGRTYYVGGGRAYFVPPAGEGKIFAITWPQAVHELMDLGDQPPPLQREIRTLLAETDSQRHFNLLLAPSYIFSEGRQALFAGGAASLKEPLAGFLGNEKLKAALLSAHVDENFYMELRLAGDLDLPAKELAAGIHTRLAEVPRQLRGYFIDFVPHPWARNLLAEFPEMVRLLAQYTRSGDHRGQAVVNSYLPAVAAHNLLMGFELTLAHQGSSTGPVVAAGGDQPKTVAEILEQKTTLSFRQDTLENSIALLSEDVGVPMKIIGADLELSGITKNQSFGLELQDKPAREILEGILRQANPDKTAESLSDPKQMLVYVIKPIDGGEQGVFITTRQQAKKRGDQLPPAFAGD